MNSAKGELCLLRHYVEIASMAGILALVVGAPASARKLRSTPSTVRAGAPPTSNSKASEGRVVEVRRSSREIAVRTAGGGIERIVIPAKTAIRAPHGASALSGIRTGMVVHAEGEADQQGRLVARKLLAR